MGRWKSKRWQRSTTVAGTFCASVVASTNTVFGGGSSSVFRNAFHAACESMCASSRMYTLLRPLTGANATLSRSSRMSSTELLEAASISITSSERAAAIARHDSHSPARLGRRPALAVEARREDLRHRGLAGPARAHEQVGVVHPPTLDRAAQRAHHRLLADDVGERARAVAAVEGLLLLLTIALRHLS